MLDKTVHAVYMQSAVRVD